MWLLDATSIEDHLGPHLIRFPPDRIPEYAILSHTWGNDEVLFADIGKHTSRTKASFNKIEYSCRQAIKDGLNYIWVDNCCIDKSSSAELSEAINSMYKWYLEAEICYAYLSDVSSSVDFKPPDNEFARSRWFTRGWTLQELLAPSQIMFYSAEWSLVQTKAALSKSIASITGIDEDILIGTRSLQSVSVAKRMSWAAYRQTTRPEDAAYCLMGLFGVNMPMLYGEGQKAFLRLQEEIMKLSDDQSLFAWVNPQASSHSRHGLLATSPRDFAQSNSMMTYQDWEPRPPYSMTNRGLCIDLPMFLLQNDIFIAALDCPAPPDYADSSFIAIYLQKVPGSDKQYVRVRVGELARVRSRGQRQTIYIRQGADGWPSDVEGVFPNHIIQLRNGPARDLYETVDVILSHQQTSNLPERMLSSRGVTNSGWIPRSMSVYPCPKKAGLLAVGILFTLVDGERFLLMLGSAGESRVGVLVMELPFEQNVWDPNSEKSEHDQFLALQALFEPGPTGDNMEIRNHRVRVDVEPVVVAKVKYFLIDIHIDPIFRSGILDLPIAGDLLGSTLPEPSPIHEKGGTAAKEEAEKKKKKGWKKLWCS